MPIFGEWAPAFRGVEDDGSIRVFFAFSQGQGGAFQQLGRALLFALADGDAAGDRNVHRVIADFKRALESYRHASDHTGEVVADFTHSHRSIAGAGQQQPEFVVATAEESALGAGHGLKATGELAQNLVAHPGSQIEIEIAQAIEVDAGQPGQSGGQELIKPAQPVMEIGKAGDGVL